jgi:hypothetical protein
MSKHDVFRARMIRDEMETLEESIKDMEERLKTKRDRLTELQKELDGISGTVSGKHDPAQELLLKLIKSGAKRVLIMVKDDSYKEVVIYVDKNRPLTTSAQLPNVSNNDVWWRGFVSMLEPTRSWKTMWKNASLEALNYPSRVLAEMDRTKLAPSQ